MPFFMEDNVLSSPSKSVSLQMERDILDEEHKANGLKPILKANSFKWKKIFYCKIKMKFLWWLHGWLLPLDIFGLRRRMLFFQILSPPLTMGLLREFSAETCNIFQRVFSLKMIWLGQTQTQTQTHGDDYYVP